MKKKLSLMLCLCFMVLAMTACGTDPTTVDYFGMSYSELQTGMEKDVSSLVSMTDENREYVKSYGSEQIIDLLAAWDNTVADLGSYQGIGEFTATKAQKTVTTDQIVKFQGRDVVVSYVYTYNYETGQADLTSATVEPAYTMGEKMETAGLNTLMGMGTVFVVLILISLIIYCFNIFPYLAKRKENKNRLAGSDDNAVMTQIEQNEAQQLTDDLELVAVISAAIAASTGTSTDAFVVRSIHRR